jgi:hypothetical protein
MKNAGDADTQKDKRMEEEKHLSVYFFFHTFFLELRVDDG